MTPIEAYRAAYQAAHPEKHSPSDCAVPCEAHPGVACVCPCENCDAYLSADASFPTEVYAAVSAAEDAARTSGHQEGAAWAARRLVAVVQRSHEDLDCRADVPPAMHHGIRRIREVVESEAKFIEGALPEEVQQQMAAACRVTPGACWCGAHRGSDLMR